MKKIIKTIMTFSIIISILYVTYYFRDEITTSITSIKLEIKDNFEESSEQIYTDKEIEEMLKSNEVTINGEYNEKLDNYCYEQLDVYAKIIYKALLNNIDKLKTGEYEIELSNALGNLMKDSNGREAINLAFQNAWNAFRLDHPEVYYVDVKKVYLTTKTITIGTKVKYEFYLNNKEGEKSLDEQIENVDESINKINEKREEIIKNIPDSNDFAKILYIHNWIIDNIEYDINMQNDNNNNIYGAIIENKVVCEGYAKTFKYLLDELDVPCVIICGDVTDENGITEKHAWNAVYLDGNWYAVDVTWDDPVIIGGGKATNELKYKYFLKGSIELNKNHKQSGRLSDDVKEIEFEYPELSQQDYKK